MHARISFLATFGIALVLGSPLRAAGPPALESILAVEGTLPVNLMITAEGGIADLAEIEKSSVDLLYALAQ